MEAPSSQVKVESSSRHMVVGFIFTVHAVFVTVVDIMAVDFHTIVTDEFLNNDWFIRSVGAVIHAVVYRCEDTVVPSAQA